MSANQTRKPIATSKTEPTNALEELIIEFLESLELERAASPYTLRNYHFYLKRFAQWMLRVVGSSDIERLDLATLKKYRLYLSRYSNRHGRTLSRVTQAYHIIALRSWLKWLVKNDRRVLSPEKIDLPRTQSRSLSYLSHSQVDRLLSQPSLSTRSGLRDKAILEVLFSTGLRVSELVSLNRDQVDDQRREFGIIGKGGRARVVFLSTRAAEWLARYLSQRADHFRPLFIRSAGRQGEIESQGESLRLTARSIQRIVERYRKKAGLPVRITPHGLRHSFATDLLSAGAGLREIQEMLGHKNIQTTQIYTHVTNPQLRKVHEQYHSGNR